MRFDILRRTTLKLFFACFGALLSLVILESAGRAAEADPRVKQAEEHLDAWRIAEAEKISAALLKENPHSPAALDLSDQIGMLIFPASEPTFFVRSFTVDFDPVQAGRWQEGARFGIEYVLDIVRRT